MTVAASPAPRSDLRVRAIAGILLMALALFAIVYGGGSFWALVTAATLLILKEFCALLGVEGWPRLGGMALLVIVFVLAQPRFELVDKTIWSTYAVAVLVGAALNWRVGLGMIYAGLAGLALLFLHDQYDGINLTVWVLMTVWATDIGAYFAGRSIGGPKLAPRLSPNKTWAGLLGGMAAALIVSMVAGHWLHVPLALTALGSSLALLAQAGDLFESWLKRRAGVKDSGKLLPGHGGAMDRLDGVVPVVIVVAGLLVVGYV